MSERATEEPTIPEMLEYLDASCDIFDAKDAACYDAIRAILEQKKAEQEAEKKANRLYNLQRQMEDA